MNKKQFKERIKIIRSFRKVLFFAEGVVKKNTLVCKAEKLFDALNYAQKLESGQTKKQVVDDMI